MKVLIVDDSMVMRRVIAGCLKKIGVTNVVEATNGEEAVNLLLPESDIDLVLMDWNMPVMNGFEALKTVRASKVDTPIVMITTEVEKDKVLDAIKNGANDYLAKPFGPNDIQTRLKRFLEPDTA